jgi:hypothetical protein
MIRTGLASPREWPRHGCRKHQYNAARDRDWLQAIRKEGELADYTDEELITIDLDYAWKAPE